MKAIAYDMGGVFATNPPRNVIREIAIRYDLDVQRIVKAWNRHWMPFITGKSTEEDFYIALINELGLEGNRRETVDWLVDKTRTFTAIIPENLEMIKAIKQATKLKTALLSNTTKEWWAYIKQEHDLSIFDPIVLSCDEGTAKPGEKVFTILLDRLQERPEDVLFIDDKASNCDAAGRAGIQAFPFTSLSAMLDELLARKLLDERTHARLKEEIASDASTEAADDEGSPKEGRSEEEQ